MRTLTLTLLAWVALSVQAHAQQPAPYFPDVPRVQLVLSEPGQPVYSRFGHIAIRVIGPGTHDRVFNFGITNFKRKGYLADFLEGRVIFWGKIRPWAKTLRRMKRQDRTVKVYPVHLTTPQVKALIPLLERAMLKEHREYFYDIFRDNCATRIRDLIDQITDGAIKTALGEKDSGLTFRDDVRRGLASLPALLFFTEWMTGPSLDEPRTSWEMGYRPAWLIDSMREVTVQIKGKPTPLVGDPEVIYTREAPSVETGWPQKGQALLAFIGVIWLLIGVLAPRLSRRWRGALMILWLLPAIFFGLFLEVMVVASSAIDLQSNALLAVFLSLDLWLLWPAFRLFRRQPVRAERAIRGYLWLRLGVSVAVLVVGLIWAQAGGPLAPRLMALAGLWMLIRAIGDRR